MRISAIVDRKGRAFETVRESASLSEAVGIMHRLSIGSVGVLGRNNAEILGMVSQQELMAGIAERGVHALKLPVVVFMRRPVLFCRCEDDAANVMLTMTRERFRHSVVRRPSGDITGLVSLGDLVAALLEEAQLEAGVLRDMARGRLLAQPG